MTKTKEAREAEETLGGGAANTGAELVGAMGKLKSLTPVGLAIRCARNARDSHPPFPQPRGRVLKGKETGEST